MSRIQLSDSEILQNNIGSELIKERYRLEMELEKIMEAEELYWKQRGWGRKMGL